MTLPGQSHKRGLVVAAPASGSGKTTITLGLLRALRNKGLRVGGAKVGPDYIDPRFHAAACGDADCLNLDSWAMSEAALRRFASSSCPDDGLLIIEGVMGLFDGAAGAPEPTGLAAGSTAETAARLGLPVILIIDARGMAQSAAALARGFRDFHPDVTIAGVIFSMVGSARHQAMLNDTMARAGLRVFGHIPKRDGLTLPSRHLGLVQAAEHGDLEGFIAAAAETVAAGCDLDGLVSTAGPLPRTDSTSPRSLPPPGQRIAVARDVAFAFCYAHVLREWTAGGAEILPFSPLADEPPDPDADAIYLPGGYPELHGAKLAANTRFLDGLGAAARNGTRIHGECGGLMVLGRAITDPDGASHPMAGLLPVETSMRPRKMTLGYREIRAWDVRPIWPGVDIARGHEFHFAHVSSADMEPNLYRIADAAGRDLGSTGYRVGSVSGSFVHLIAPRAAPNRDADLLPSNGETSP